MYAKIVNNEIVKYPYTITDLQKDNPNVSFPVPLDNETLNAFNITVVYDMPAPQVNFNQRIEEGIPTLRGDTWVRTWNVIDRTPEEAAEIGKEFRSIAYRTESDPLFFKAQRGEATMQEWLDKVTEIKQRYSY